MDFSILFYLILILNAWNVSGNQKYEEKKQGFVQYRQQNRVQFKKGDLTTAAPLINASKLLPEYEGLVFFINNQKSMGGFVNETHNVGLCFINLDDGIIKILVDAKIGKIVRYAHLQDISLIENKDLKGDVIQVIKKILYEYEFKDKKIAGESSKIKPSSEEGLALYSEVFLHLGHPQEGTQYRSFTFLNNLARNLRHIARGHLKGLVPVNGDYPVKQNLNRFVTITVGIKKLFDKAITGLQGILKRGVKFEFNSLYNAKNGAEVFVYILRQTGSKFNLANVWGKRFLENVSEVLKIIQLLGGGEKKNGVDETIAVVSHVWEALTLKLSITSLFKYLTEASAAETWSNGNGDFSQIVKDLKNITDEQARKYDSSGVTGPLVTFFSNLTANTLLYDKVNISGIVEKWRRRDVVGGLKTVIDVCLKWFSPEKYNNLIFDSFLAFMNSSSDPAALKRLMPQISMDHFTKGNDSLWKQLSGKFDIDSQLKNNGDPNEILSKIPGFREFSKTFSSKMGTPFDFTEILKGGTISGYFSRNLVQQPVKWTFDFVKDSGNFVKDIFWKPIKNLIPGIPHDPVFGLPTIPPILEDLVPKKPEDKTEEKKKCEKDCDEKIEKSPPTTTECEKTTKETATKAKCSDCEEDKEKIEKVPTEELPEKTTEEPPVEPTKKECDDCKKKDTEPTTEEPTKKECSDCKKETEPPTKPTEEPTTEKDCSDCKKKVTELPKEKVTEKECSDCKKKVTESTKEKPKKDCKDCKEEVTEPSTKLKGIEFKNRQGFHEVISHNMRNHMHRMHEMHLLKHHELRHYKSNHADSKHHESRHHIMSNHVESKHHESKHHESKHHEPKHHESKHHESKHHESKHHESKHHELKHHELKHHGPSHHESKHYDLKHHELKHHESKHHESKQHESKHYKTKRHNLKHHELKHHDSEHRDMKKDYH